MSDRIEVADQLDRLARKADLTLLEVDTVVRAAALLRTQEQGPTWQPISTAPKDGTSFIAWPVWSNSPVAEVRWRAMKRIEGRWESRGLAVRGDPTHWLPLPTPPQENRDD